MKQADWLNRCHFGDVRDVLKRMIADGVKVQTIVTSPPYWGLRSYLPADHRDKVREIGSEPTLQEFLQTMVGVFDLCREVLADDGTMWVNMGDSYANDGKWGGATGGKHVAALHGDTGIGRGKVKTGLPPKSLIGQPWRLAFALQDAGWVLRQDIIWAKPGPMPESTEDRCTKSHEYIFLLSKSPRYYFDFNAIKEPSTGRAAGNVNPQKGEIAYAEGDEKLRTRAGLTAFAERTRSARDSFRRDDSKRAQVIPGQSVGTHRPDREENDYPLDERRKRSVWTVATSAYGGAHFAVFPPKLIEPCILAGAPAGAVVLDIFMGSGTTAQVSERLGRNWIGIDIDERNGALQTERLRQPSLDLEAA